MNSLYTGLRAYWPLVNKDQVVGSMTSTNVGAVAFSSGIVVGASSHDGTSGKRIDFSSGGGLPLGNSPRTWAGWCFNRSGVATQDALFSYGTTVVESRYAVFTNQGTSGTVYLEHFGNDYASPTATISTGVWNFLVWTYSGGTLSTTTISLYVNSSAVGTAKSGAGSGASTTVDGPGAIGINTDGMVLAHNGMLAEIAMWSRVLSYGEIYWLYNKGLGRTYPFDGRPAPALKTVGPGVMHRRNRLTGPAV